MAEESTHNFRELLKDWLKEDYNNYAIEKFNNADSSDGFIGEIVYITLINKRNHVKDSIVIKQQKGKDGKPFEFTIIPFKNEMLFYKKILPKLYKMDENRTFSYMIPKCLSTSDEGVMKIALENLNSQNFKLFERTKYFDDTHFDLLFQTYGHFHGLSMSLKMQHGDEYQSLTSEIHNIWKEAYKSHNNTAKYLKAVACEVQQFFDASTERHLIEKLRVYETKGDELIYDALNQDKDNGIILHGDTWSNNFMFKYDENGKPQEVKFIDFQMINSGSPVFDLSYCLYSGGSSDAFNKLEEYLKMYHTSYSSTLHSFGFQAESIYSFSTLKTEWKNFCKFGFGMGLMLWGVKLVDKNTQIDFSKEEELGEPLKIDETKKDDYKQRVRELVMHMYENDFF